MLDKFILGVVLLAAVVSVVSGADVCNECMSNGAYCRDETSFQLCIDEKNPAAEIHDCPANKVCTNANNICVDKSEVDNSLVKNVCNAAGGGDMCNKCPSASDAHQLYGCVSATQFSRCMNNEITTIVSSCDEGTFCSFEMYQKQGIICSPKSVLDFFKFKETCSNSGLPTTTHAPTTKPDMDRMKAHCLLGKDKSNPYKFFYIPNPDDNTCETYLYCEEIAGSMEAVMFRCQSGYYDESKGKCTEQRPDSCSAPSTVSTASSASTASTASTASSAATDPTATTVLPSQEYCRDIQSEVGPLSNDEFCREYFVCEQIGGNWVATITDCEDMYFSKIELTCVPDKPADCPTA